MPQGGPATRQGNISAAGGHNRCVDRGIGGTRIENGGGAGERTRPRCPAGIQNIKQTITQAARKRCHKMDVSSLIECHLRIGEGRCPIAINVLDDIRGIHRRKRTSCHHRRTRLAQHCQTSPGRSIPPTWSPRQRRIHAPLGPTATAGCPDKFELGKRSSGENVTPSGNVTKDTPEPLVGGPQTRSTFPLGAAATMVDVMLPPSVNCTPALTTISGAAMLLTPPADALTFVVPIVAVLANPVLDMLATPDYSKSRPCHPAHGIPGGIQRRRRKLSELARRQGNRGWGNHDRRRRRGPVECRGNRRAGDQCHSAVASSRAGARPSGKRGARVRRRRQRDHGSRGEAQAARPARGPGGREADRAAAGARCHYGQGCSRVFDCTAIRSPTGVIAPL